MTGLDAIMCH